MTLPRPSEVAAPSYPTVFDYYRNQNVLPTHGQFESRQELERHERHRRHLFLDKLQLPPRLFQGADLIEFGPDSGENALVFAQWGADCSLMEPNDRALPTIRHYFEQYELANRLTALEPISVEEYALKGDPEKRFDFVVAEGFVYTLKPETVWMNLFSRLLKPGGFLVFYFLESAGSFFDLFLKVVHSRMKGLTGLGPLETSEKVFQAKWDSIPHIRTLESWTMDVMENPFIRAPYFNDTAELCRGLRSAGLTLYSSWPTFKHDTQTYWHKIRLSPEEEVSRQEKFLDQSRLSFFFGRTLFSPTPVPRRLMENLLSLADGLVDEFRPADARALRQGLEALGAFLREGDLESSGREAGLEILASTIHLVQLLEEGDPAVISEFCATDPAFLATWGMPTHYLVFTKPTPA